MTVAAAPTMLFDPDRHEALHDSAWDEPRARAAIAAIADDIERARLPSGLWPVHPQDEEGDLPHGGFKGLYLGAAGVAWALWWLQREGAAVLRHDPADGFEALHAAYLEHPDSGEVVPSYYLGEVGVLLAWWRLSRAAPLADRLHDAVRANIGNPTNEALWAAPGTMLAAWHLWRATHEDRWRSLFLDNVEQVWRTWAWDEAAGCHLWTQDLYGRTVQYLGAGHGFAGNVYSLLLGASLLDDARRDELLRRCEHTLQTMAQREGAQVNWRPGTYTPRPGKPAMLVQWCHGAPGIVTALVPFPVGRSATVDALLIGAGETVWHAGPLAKGPGLCHGTAGNALALLALYRRTGDTRWLDRARAFAMHAVGQCERARRQHGRGRHTLWTGDAGLAVALWLCVRGRDGMPSRDFID